MQLTVTVLSTGNLLLQADNELRKDIKDSIDYGKNYWQIMADIFEPLASNGSFTHFDAGDSNPFVGLTNAPCIAEAMDYSDEGRATIDGRFWYFSDYMVRDDLEMLKNTGRVIYQLAN